MGGYVSSLEGRSWQSVKFGVFLACLTLGFSWLQVSGIVKASPRASSNGWWSQRPGVNVGKDPTCQGRRHSPGGKLQPLRSRKLTGDLEPPNLEIWNDDVPLQSDSF